VGQNLEIYTGVYQQDTKNTFVITKQGGLLYLSINRDQKEKLLLQETHIYKIENTETTIRFEINSKSRCEVLHFQIGNQHSVAKRLHRPFLKELTFSRYLKEISIGAIILIILIKAGLYFNHIWSERCSSSSGSSCFLSIITSVLKKDRRGSGDSLRKLVQIEKQEAKEKIFEACQSGKAKACVYKAKYLMDQNRVDESIELLKNICLKQNFDLACSKAHNYIMEKQSVKKAILFSQDACRQKIGMSCYLLAKREKKNSPSRERLLDLACNLNNGESCYELSFISIREKKYKKGHEFMDKACQKDKSGSCYFLAEIKKFIKEDENCTKLQTDCMSADSFYIRYVNKEEGEERILKNCSTYITGCSK
jgi:hypothetical protein